MIHQFPSLFEQSDPAFNRLQPNLFVNTGTSGVEPDLFSKSVPDLFSNVEPDLFSATSETDFNEEYTEYLVDTEHTDEVLSKDLVVSNLHLVADQLAGLGHYTLSNIVDSVSRLVP